tara:strand:+ start:35242 stop:35859 length:618 start_codon:yes stop_codon:yes gene_type:complete
MPNLTNALSHIDLATSASIIAKMDLSDGGDSRIALIESAIQEVSAQITEYLGVHTLAVERTERYELRRFSKLLSLDAKHITGTPTVKIAGLPSQLAAATAETIDETYILNARSGLIRFVGDQPYAPAFVEVTYNGGYFATAGELGMKHYWLTDAAELQILYRLQRQDSLGGNIDTAGGQGTNFQGKYNFLPSVRETLRSHRRADV